MKQVQTAVARCLQEATGIRTVCGRSPVAGDYPLLAVAVEEGGTVLVAGGRLAERTYRVRVTAASDRRRQDNTALLSQLPAHLLRGVPMDTEEGRRTLHPLDIRTGDGELTFSVELCVPVPPLQTGPEAATHTMQTLHFGV